MNIEDTLTSIWKYMDNVRGEVPGEQIGMEAITALAEGKIQGELNYEVIVTILFHSRGIDHAGIFTTPEIINEFLADMAGLIKPTSVLDATCGCGLLLSKVIETCAPKEVAAIEISPEAGKIASALLGDQYNVTIDDVLQTNEITGKQFDLILADAPLGVPVRREQLPDFLADNKPRNLGEAVALIACNHLSDSGTAAITLNSNALDSNTFIKAITDQQCHISACLHVPKKTRLNTHISSIILLIKKGPQKDIFVGQISKDTDHKKRLLSNLNKRNSDKHPSLGRICSLKSFISYEALESEHRLRQLVRRSSLIKLSFKDLLIKYELFKRDSGKETPSPSNSMLFLDQNRTRIYLDPSQVPEKNTRFTCLEFDADKVNTHYLKRWLESDLGLIALSAAGANSHTGFNPLTTKTLERLTCYLPDIDEQKKLLDADRQLDRLRNEINEIESLFWTGTESGSELLNKANNVNKEDSYDDWVESLPHPIASILWRHKISAEDPRIRYRILLHFFEAFAEFTATIHLSAYISQEDLWQTIQPRLLETLENQNLSLERATFGTWKVVVEILGSNSRKMLGGEQLELAESIYSSYKSWLERLCAPEITTIISVANGIRNNESHGGALGVDHAQDIENTLLGLTQQIRQIIGKNWLGHELIIADLTGYTDGEFKYNAPLLMGTRNEFQRVERTTTVPLNSGELYCLSPGKPDGLKILPLIKVMASPQNVANACYFYNRTEPEGQRFVSYHFEHEASVCELHEDTRNAMAQITTYHND